MTESVDMATRHPRLTIQLATHQAKLLTLWARFNGRPATTFASQILANRIEANADGILDSVKVAARMEGVTEDEIMDRWLGEPEDDE